MLRTVARAFVDLHGIEAFSYFLRHIWAFWFLFRFAYYEPVLRGTLLLVDSNRLDWAIRGVGCPVSPSGMPSSHRCLRHNSRVRKRASRFFLVLSSAIRNTAEVSEVSSNRQPAGSSYGRGGPTRRRGWVPAAGIQELAPCGGFWQQGRIPLLLSVFFPRRSLRYTGGSFPVISSLLTYKISPSKRIAAMHLPTSPARIRDSSNSFGYISCLLFSFLLLCLGYCICLFCHGLLSHGFTDMDFTA